MGRGIVPNSIQKITIAEYDFKLLSYDRLSKVSGLIEFYTVAALSHDAKL